MVHIGIFLQMCLFFSIFFLSLHIVFKNYTYYFKRMAFNKQLITIISVLFSLTACTGGGSDDSNPTPQPPLAEKRPIHISPTLQSRATESNFEIGDYIKGIDTERRKEILLRRFTSGT